MQATRVPRRSTRTRIGVASGNYKVRKLILDHHNWQRAQRQIGCAKRCKPVRTDIADRYWRSARYPLYEDRFPESTGGTKRACEGFQ